jgi:hypothetical protein
MMEALLRLYREYGWSASYIARRTGRNQSDISQLLAVARHPDLAQLVREEVIKPTVAGEIHRLPEPVRQATIDEVRAGAVRTVADVKARRTTVPPAAAPAPAPPAPQGPAQILPDSKHPVISLPPALVPPGEPAQPVEAAGPAVLPAPAAPAAPTTLEQRLDGIRALAAMIDATSPAGKAVLAAAERDLRGAYDRLATYLARRDRQGG